MPTGVRLFSGYAGWAAGQLEGEIAEGAWFVVDALAEDVFCADPNGCGTTWCDASAARSGCSPPIRPPVVQLSRAGACPADSAQSPGTLRMMGSVGVRPR